MATMADEYYKVILPDGTSPTKEFDYGAYLPSSGAPGPWLPEIKDAQIRKKGYYVSKYWRFWYREGARVFVCQCKGLVCESTNGVEKQACCSTLRLVKEITQEALAQPSDKNFNLGNFNTGLSNIGEANPGNFNIGSRNTGSLNMGDFNTGDSNTGIDNVGDENLGSLNTGSHNTGHSNSGSFNKGSYNSGDYNEGHANSGSFNKGNRNTGKWNACNYSSGFFNTLEPCAVMFDKPTNIKVSQVRLPKWLQKPDIKKALSEAETGDIMSTFDLPNFDAEIFERITGIGKEQILKAAEEAARRRDRFGNP